MVKQKYYVVWQGRKPGIYASWAECEAQVKGFAGAEYKSFPNREMAENAFRNDYDDYKGKPASSQQWLFAPIKPILPSICVDAACSGSPGPVEYQGLLTENGERVFHCRPLRGGTNNVGEFLAVVHGLGWLQEKKLAYPIYSDSESAISWVRSGKCNTKLAQRKTNEELFDLIARAEKLLAENQYPNTVLKWDTNAWGEIPADFGRK